MVATTAAPGCLRKGTQSAGRNNTVHKGSVKNYGGKRQILPGTEKSLCMLSLRERNPF